MAVDASTTTSTPTRRPQRFRGVVVSAKSKDTIVVRVTTYEPHPKYKKYLRRSKKFHAHDPGNTAPEGAEVIIEASRPYSRLKRFRLVKIVAMPREGAGEDELLAAAEERKEAKEAQEENA